MKYKTFCQMLLILPCLGIVFRLANNSFNGEFNLKCRNWGTGGAVERGLHQPLQIPQRGPHFGPSDPSGAIINPNPKLASVASLGERIYVPRVLRSPLCM